MYRAGVRSGVKDVTPTHTHTHTHTRTNGRTNGTGRHYIPRLRQNLTNYLIPHLNKSAGKYFYFYLCVINKKLCYRKDTARPSIFSIHVLPPASQHGVRSGTSALFHHVRSVSPSLFFPTRLSYSRYMFHVPPRSSGRFTAPFY